MSRRVELLPQSSAATTSATHVLAGQFRNTDFARYERSDRVVGSNEIVRQVRVQALHADAGAPDAAAGLRPPVSHGRRRSPRRVVVVGLAQLNFVDERFKAMDAAVTLESTHRRVKLRVDQPEECGHGCAVTQVRLVLNHDRSAVESSHDDRTPTGQSTAEERFDDGEVVGRRVAKGQRQNSRVRTRRETKALADVSRDVVDVDADGVTSVDTDDGDTSGCRPGSPVLWETVPSPGRT